MIQVWWFGSQTRLPCDRSIDRMLCVWPKLISFCALLHSHDQLILMMMIERSAPANASIDTHLLARVCVRYVCTNGFFTFYGMPDCSRHDYVIIECAKNCTQRQQQHQSQLFGINCCIFAFSPSRLSFVADCSLCVLHLVKLLSWNLCYALLLVMMIGNILHTKEAQKNGENCANCRPIKIHVCSLACITRCLFEWSSWSWALLSLQNYFHLDGAITCANHVHHLHHNMCNNCLFIRLFVSSSFPPLFHCFLWVPLRGILAFWRINHCCAAHLLSMLRWLLYFHYPIAMQFSYPLKTSFFPPFHFDCHTLSSFVGSFHLSLSLSLTSRYVVL